MTSALHIVVKTDHDKQDLIGRIERYDLGNGPLSILVDIYDPSRTHEQNNLFHEWVREITKRSPHIGHGWNLSFEAWKRFFKKEGLGFTVEEGPEGPIEIIPETHKLGKKAMSEFMTWMQQFVYDLFDGEIRLTNEKEAA